MSKADTAGDIYNRSLVEKNSIQEAPKGYADEAANKLLKYLGSFWAHIHEGTEFVKGLQGARGIRIAQFYLDLLEALKLQDRKGLPVFHKEMWKPLILRKSRKNQAPENVISMDGDAVLGPQGEQSKYGKDTTLLIGGLAGLEGFVSYPVDENIVTIVSGLADNILQPKVAYKVRQDFDPADKESVVYINGSLIFPEDKDPFGENSPFQAYDVGDVVAGEADIETVVWGSDVLIDKDYIATHMGYALGVACESSELAKRILNAGWDSLSSGLTPELLRTLLAALANVPVIREETEYIQNITVDDDGTKIVKTDKHTYNVYKGAELRDSVVVGATLKKGEFLDKSIKIYPLLTDVSQERLKATTEYADILEKDVAVIDLPRSIISTETANGLSADWVPTEVLEVDGKPCFAIDGPQDDVDAFWWDVWRRSDEEGFDLDACIKAAQEADGTIKPAKFFLEYMIGANTLIVTLDSLQLEDASKIRAPMFFNLLTSVIPSGMRLFFIEHIAVLEDEEDEGEDGGAELYAAIDTEDEFDIGDLPGIKGREIPTYEDEVEVKFYRDRKRKANQK